jgi:predicted nucleic acid-binding protein
MRPPLWVIDTNVFVSAAITPGGVCDLLLQCAVSGLFIPAWDNKILREYREVLGRPKFRLSKASVRGLLAALPRSGFHPGVPLSLELPDPDDLPFMAVAKPHQKAGAGAIRAGFLVDGKEGSATVLT